MPWYWYHFRCLFHSPRTQRFFALLYVGCPWFKTVEPLSLRKGRRLRHKLCIDFSVFDDDDGHMRGQTSCPVVGAEIQTNCNFEAHVYYCNYFLGFTFVASLCAIFYLLIIFLYSSLVISFWLVISFASYTKIFYTLRYHQAQVRDQQHPSQTNALNMARFRKAVHNALWMQLALVVCYAEE